MAWATVRDLERNLRARYSIDTPSVTKSFGQQGQGACSTAIRLYESRFVGGRSERRVIAHDSGRRWLATVAYPRCCNLLRACPE